jgi:hypothetical protein
MASEAADIAKMRRELVRYQEIAQSFASQYKQYRAQKSRLAGPYEVMMRLAFERARRKQESVRQEMAYQEKLAKLNLQIAALESKLPK